MTKTTGKFIPYDVVILGAGYASLMAAMQLGRRKWRLRIALVSASAKFVERQRLQEYMVAPVTSRIPSISAFFSGTPVEFIINHCRLDRLRDVLPSLVFKSSFRNYVLAHFDENDTAPMPILYRLA